MHIAYSRFFGSMIYFTLFFNFIFLFDGVIVFSAKFKFLGFFFLLFKGSFACLQLVQDAIYSALILYFFFFHTYFIMTKFLISSHKFLIKFYPDVISYNF